MSSPRLVNMSSNKVTSLIGNIESTLATRDKMEKSLDIWDKNFNFLLKDNTVIFTGHKAYTFLEFHKPESAKKFLALFQKPTNTEVHFVNTKIITILIEKIPAKALEEYLHKILERWGNIISINPTKMALINGDYCYSGSNRVIFKLNPSSTTSDIPYFIRVENLRVYLHIPGRPKICFRCQATTHLVSQCPNKYCMICHTYKEPHHLCTQSYATKLMSKQDSWQNMLTQAQEEVAALDLGLQFDNTDHTIARSGSLPSSLLRESAQTTDDVQLLMTKGAESPLPSNIENFNSQDSNQEKVYSENSLSPIQCKLDTHPKDGNESGEIAMVSANRIQSTPNFGKSKRISTAKLHQGLVKKKTSTDTTKTYSLRNKSLPKQSDPFLEIIDSQQQDEASGSTSNSGDLSMDFEVTTYQSDEHSSS